ncbi:MAG TPA: glutamine--tRNA ligase/YqeY domain fusion protein [Clostridiaceae bacterium]|jgi:glutaminyl-tRNA synthetase|nr:glutamine--tRNA ligase/YqeY domain fusion protein [Clostridiaceae bacterium]
MDNINEISVNNPDDAGAMPESTNFIEEIINEDLRQGKNDGRVHTRFPPEPNGYLHIGHAKAICIDFGIAEKYNGLCNLRFDDTNPVKEDVEYVESIKEDIHWLGYDWEDRLFYASDYFERLYEYAVELIKAGKAYVCDLSPDEIREYRGTLTEPGKNSPYRDRSVEENLELFERMKNGEFKEGEKVLRAKIDMASPNINMRDPVIYRILHTSHHRTGNKWCIYPMYDFQHPLSDAIEGITHSLCSLEYEDHRPLYNWFVENVSVPSKPRQIEFARLNLNYTVMSKRKLITLVKEGLVRGWDDPRMPTLCGLRRRGYTPGSIKAFIEKIGVAKTYSVVDIALLEHCIREELNKTANRVMAVLNPVKVIIDNYPEGQVEWFDAENNPENPDAGTRKIPFSREIYIERDDFMEDPPKKFFRLAPGREVRLKHAYYITCNSVVKNSAGEIVELHCTYDPASKGGWTEDGRRVQGTLHWVSAPHAVNAEIRLYDNLFTVENPDSDDYLKYINPDSLKVLTDCKVEQSLADVPLETKFQFLRMGYFSVDYDSIPGKPVFNRIVTLKDTWAKIQNK